ncbi:MAG TPA: hypothetical protein VH601_06080 [Bryobacteraceae bacterium]|jgi:hypothetical protein
MPANQLLRPQFFEGQFLGAEDLTAALEYSRLAAARHALGAHTWGIAVGLGIKEIDGPGGEVLDFIQPGFAWDGFGRPIVLLNPASIPADLFKSFVYDPLIDEPAGRLVEVWIRYREIPTQEPAPGFASCTPGNDFARALESYTIEIGPRDDAAMRDNIIVAGSSVKAEEAFHAFDPADALIPDASIPFQTFPSAGAKSRWLVPLGYVRWRPNPIAAQPGAFKKILPADKDKAAAFRVLIGSVAAAIHAPEGTLRLKNRTTAASLVASADLVWVEGDLRVQGNARLFGSKAVLVNALGQDEGIPLEIRRAGAAVGRSLQLRIGSAEAGDNRLEVGPETGGGFVPKFAVRDDGRVGIGTAAPSAKLEINDGDLVMKAAADDAGDLVFQDKNGVQKGRVFSNSAPGPGLYLSSADNTPRIAIDDQGRVGINTTSPNRAVTIAGSAGTYLNVLADGGTHEVLIGADASGGIISTMTNHDLVFRSGVNVTRMTIQAAGNVGINTAAPAVQLHVVGDRIRLEGGGKHIDLRTDGSSVDLHSETNSVFIRASGGAGNNNIAMNSFPGDGGVGIGISSPTCKLHVVDAQSGPGGDITKHVAIIENAASANADVLALKLGASPALADNNFITFFSGSGAVGAIEGNGVGVALNTTGADFAECLPLAANEQVGPGDVVAIVDGKLTLDTRDAHQFAAISTRPAVVGNMSASIRQARVALLGQTPVRVRGRVRVGDVLVCSGKNDGAAIALSPRDAVERERFDIIGTAWESSNMHSVKPIRTAIGMVSSVFSLLQATLGKCK